MNSPRPRMAQTPVEAVGVVLARGGSKGFPGKNVADVAGKPCVAWTLEAMRDSQCLSTRVLSTDSDEIAQHAHYGGAQVIRRSADLASDTATVDAAARHAISTLEDKVGRLFPDEIPVVILYANVPVRPPGLIDRAVRMLVESGADSVQSYQPVGKYHPWWLVRIDEQSGQVRPWEGEVLNHSVFRRQDLPAAFVPDGAVIAVTRKSLFLKVQGAQPGPHAFFGIDRRALINGESAVVDIDWPIDRLVADAILRESPPVQWSQRAG